MPPLCFLFDRVQPEVFSEIAFSHDRLFASFCKGKVSTDLGAIQSEAIRRLANELHRGSRHHAEGGFCGDLMIPIVVKQA